MNPDVMIPKAKDLIHQRIAVMKAEKEFWAKWADYPTASINLPDDYARTLLLPGDEGYEAGAHHGRSKLGLRGARDSGRGAACVRVRAGRRGDRARQLPRRGSIVPSCLQVSRNSS